MITAGDWLLMTWGEFASYLVLAVLAAGLVGLLVGYRVGVRSRPEPHVPSDCRPYGATTRRPPAHDAFSPDSLHPLDHAEGGPSCR